MPLRVCWTCDCICAAISRLIRAASRTGRPISNDDPAMNGATASESRVICKSIAAITTAMLTSVDTTWIGLRSKLSVTALMHQESDTMRLIKSPTKLRV